MKNKRGLIEKRIRNLFGEVGYENGQFYSDNGDTSIVEVINDGGGVRRVMYAESTTRLIEYLNAIEKYLWYKKCKEREEQICEAEDVKVQEDTKKTIEQ